MRQIIFTSCCQLLLLGFIGSVDGQQWNRFRGPNGTGLSEATTVPVRWVESDYNWTISLPGKGHSSPVSWDKKLFVTCADLAAGARYLLCIDTADGSVLWKKSFPFK